MPVAPAHDAAHVRGDDPPARLAVTKALTAIDPDHPELAAARAAGIPLEPWQQVVADAAVGRRLVAVAGTHGKSTSAGWLVHVLAAGGLDPGAFVGALLPADLTGIGVPATARRGAGAPFVVEADEYAGNFDAYRPDVIVLTSAEWDHPDVFADRDGGPGRLRGVDPGRRVRPVLVANVADPGVAELVARLDGWAGRVVGTSLGARGADVRGRIVAEEPAGTVLDGERPRSASGTVEVRVGLAGAAQRGERAGRRGGRVGAGARARTPSPAGSPRSAASGGASSARARRAASWCTTTTATTRRRSARRWPRSASASPAGASGPSTSR